MKDNTTPQPTTEAGDPNICFDFLAKVNAPLSPERKAFWDWTKTLPQSLQDEIPLKDLEKVHADIYNHRTTPTTREVLEELELALKENLAKWDKPLLYLHEIHTSIKIAIAKQLETVGLGKGGER